MRIILEHTDVQSGESTRKAIIEVGHDDLSLPEMWEELIRPALIAMTFSPECVDSLFEKEESP